MRNVFNKWAELDFKAKATIVTCVASASIIALAVMNDELANMCRKDLAHDELIGYSKKACQMVSVIKNIIP
tara:strand:- start:382 stop:594 length:213 start_codon:yes stop_codon:yes gene_type:complete